MRSITTRVATAVAMSFFALGGGGTAHAATAAQVTPPADPTQPVTITFTAPYATSSGDNGTYYVEVRNKFPFGCKGTGRAKVSDAVAGQQYTVTLTPKTPWCIGPWTGAVKFQDFDPGCASSQNGYPFPGDPEPDSGCASKNKLVSTIRYAVTGTVHPPHAGAAYRGHIRSFLDSKAHPVVMKITSPTKLRRVELWFNIECGNYKVFPSFHGTTFYTDTKIDGAGTGEEQGAYTARFTGNGHKYTARIRLRLRFRFVSATEVRGAQQTFATIRSGGRKVNDCAGRVDSFVLRR